MDKYMTKIKCAVEREVAKSRIFCTFTLEFSLNETEIQSIKRIQEI